MNVSLEKEFMSHRDCTCSPSVAGGQIGSRRGCTGLHSHQLCGRILVALHPCQHLLFSSFYYCLFWVSTQVMIKLYFTVVIICISWMAFHVFIGHLYALRVSECRETFRKVIDGQERGRVGVTSNQGTAPAWAQLSCSTAANMGLLPPSLWVPKPVGVCTSLGVVFLLLWELKTEWLLFCFCLLNSYQYFPFIEPTRELGERT